MSVENVSFCCIRQTLFYEYRFHHVLNILDTWDFGGSIAMMDHLLNYFVGQFFRERKIRLTSSNKSFVNCIRYLEWFKIDLSSISFSDTNNQILFLVIKLGDACHSVITAC